MPTRETTWVSLCALLMTLLLGCASSRAPSGWLENAGQTPKEAYGAWISVVHSDGSSEQTTDGEFIAVGEDSLFILTDGKLIGVPIVQISRGRLTTYDAEAGLLALWTTLGTLSTPSHGFYMLVSVPLWIITGSISAAAQSRTPIEKFPSNSWDELKKYARFPQGLPKGIDRQTLKAKGE